MAAVVSPKRTGSAVYEALSDYGKSNLLILRLIVPPVLDHFVRDRAKTFGISQSEFLRRVLFQTMEQYLAIGLYSLPDELVASSKTEIRLPDKNSLRTLIATLGPKAAAERLKASREKSNANLLGGKGQQTQETTKTKTKTKNIILTEMLIPVSKQ